MINMLIIIKWEEHMEYVVHCNFSRLMGEKRVTIQEVHNQTGLSRNTIANLYYDRATRIDFETIAKLCKFFQCDIETLLCCNETKEK